MLRPANQFEIERLMRDHGYTLQHDSRRVKRQWKLWPPPRMANAASSIVAHGSSAQAVIKTGALKQERPPTYGITWYAWNPGAAVNLFNPQRKE